RFVPRRRRVLRQWFRRRTLPTKALAMRATPQDAGLLLLLALLWSSSFMFIKLAVATVPPVTLAAGRITIGALVLLLFLRLRGVALPRGRAAWLPLVLVGIAGNALPFFLIGWGEQFIDSALAAMLIATTPLVAFILGHFVTSDERLTWPRGAGVLTGFVGVVVLIGPGEIASLGSHALGQLAVVGGAVCYAVAGFFARMVPPMPRAAAATGMLVSSSLIMVPLSLVLERPWELSPSAISVASVVVLGLGSTALAGIVVFQLVRRAGATFLSLNNYLNPALGVLWGVLFLSEAPTAQALAGLGIILAGLVLTNLRFGPLRARP
ncbi:MAG: DMT family transporter, partial [Alphaproteobacteria bacterium]